MRMRLHHGNLPPFAHLFGKITTNLQLYIFCTNPEGAPTKSRTRHNCVRLVSLQFQRAPLPHRRSFIQWPLSRANSNR